MITGIEGTAHWQAQQQIWEGRKEKQNKTNKPSELEDKSKESIQSEVQREKKMNRDSETCDTTNIPT